MSSLDLHQLCEDLSFVCKVMPRYLGLRLQHLTLRGHNVIPHTLQRLSGRNTMECSKGGRTAFMATRGKPRSEKSRPPGWEPDHVEPCGPVRTAALLCSGKEMPRRLWAGCLQDRVPILTATWKQRLPARC